MINTQQTKEGVRQQDFIVHDTALFKQKAFAWANEQEVCCFLDSNDDSINPYHSYEGLLAVGVKEELKVSISAFESLKKWHESRPRWAFGYLGYDLKNEVEDLSSNNFDGLHFPTIHFFEPQTVITFFQHTISIYSENPLEVFIAILHTEVEYIAPIPLPITLKNRLGKSMYLHTIQKIKEHIIEGDIYEMNFCQEFFAENVECHPSALFQKLNQRAKTPFAAFYKNKNQYVACASPERFLKKIDSQLISQPIKGTARRGTNRVEDDRLKNELWRSEKNRAENVMIVDLVRNDLAKSCKTGTIKVEELFKIYTFEHVHQMISTVVGELRADIHFVDAIKNAFPMGSMTGAPKVMSMKLIEEYEKSKRGLYSGAIGYITPNGDFDFNVVIRSILYNTTTKYLSFQVGGAIVYDSDPEEEYEECLTKAKAMLESLGL